MLEECTVLQSEVIRAIVSECSPWCGVRAPELFVPVHREDDLVRADNPR